MKVIFLDFDGVLNSIGSIVMYTRVKAEKRHEQLCPVCTSNLIYLLDKVPEAKVVISSTWRKFHSLDWLRDKLKFYGIDSSRVIDRTPFRLSDRVRGYEIEEWLEDNAALNIESFVILDDNSDMANLMHKLVKTDTRDGLTFSKVQEAIKILGAEDKSIFL